VIQFLIGLVLVSQLVAGAKDCPGRRDDCETDSTSAYQTSTIFDTAYNKNSLI
jgi:hypothetical protein